MSDRVLLVSDFNVEPLARMLAAAATGAVLTVDVSSFGQVYQTLAQPDPDPSGIAVVWARAETVLPEFARALNLEAIDERLCFEQLANYAGLLSSFAERRRHCLVVSWTLPADVRGYGMLEWRHGIGLTNLLARMNLRLAEELAEHRNIHMLDGSRWHHATSKPLAPKMWYAAKVPFANAVFDAAAKDIVAAVSALKGQSRRLIVVDLDNTLWGGVLGETGWQGIRLGGHDHIGEAYKDFQLALKALAHRGIQLAVVSKNDEAAAMEAIEQHPEMVLRRDHLAGWRINWSDKAENIAALAQELSLGLGSIVFIDDNPAERDRVRQALPEVLVPEWPGDPAQFATLLRSLACFDTPVLSAEDRNRTAMYTADRARRDFRRQIPSVDDWLITLETRIRIERVGVTNLARVAQLFNKTNQVNMATRRLGEAEILVWQGGGKRSLLALSVTDRFGDAGLVGIIGVDAELGSGTLVDFILSCRVMGRKIEHCMFAVALRELQRLGAAGLAAHYLATARNRPTLDILRESGLEEASGHIFTWDRKAAISIPSSLSVEWEP